MKHQGSHPGRQFLPNWRDHDEYGVGQTALDPIANPATVASDGLGWPNLHAALADELPHETLHRSISGVWVSMMLTSAVLSRSIGGKREAATLQPSQLLVLAPGTPVEVELASRAVTLHVSVRPNIVSEVAEEYFGIDPKNIEIDSPMGFDDQSMSSLLRSIKRELMDPYPQSALKMEYISRALAADIVRKYSHQTNFRNADNSTPLTARQLSVIKRFIDENIAESIKLKDLCEISNLGRTSFLYRFRASTGATPHAYITQARVKLSRKMLADRTIGMSYIAHACGFCDQAHFTKMFKRIYGVLPSQYRRELE